jgi:hypothetical protein
MLMTAVRTLTQALAAPGLSSSVSGSTASLSWTPPTPTGQSVIAGYRVYKASTLGGAYTQIGSALPPTQLSLADALPATQFYKVEAFDQYTTGSRSAGVQCNPVTGQRLKFHPGIHYWYIDQNQSLATQLARIQALKAQNPLMQGALLYWNWALMSNPVKVGGTAQYDGSWATGDQTLVNNQRGFKLWNTFLNVAASLGIQLMFHNYSYGGSSNAGAQPASFPSSYAPTYLSGSAYGPNTPTVNGIFGGVWINAYTANTVGRAKYYRYWVPAVMQELIAMAVAYGAQFDSHPNVEVTSWLDESTMDAQTSYSDAGWEACAYGPGNFFQAIAAGWPTTIRRWWGNYLLSTPAMDRSLAAAYAADWAIGGPDTANESGTSFRSITADFRYRGLTAALGNGGVRDNTVPDYRTIGGGQVRVVEPEDLNNPPSAAAGPRFLGDGNPVSIVFQANLMGCTHLAWYDNGYSGPPSNQTGSTHPNLLDFVNSAAQGGNVAVNGRTAGISLTNTTYPSSWPQTAIGVPNAPAIMPSTGLTAWGPKAAIARWKPPSSIGSTPITKYRLYVRISGVDQGIVDITPERLQDEFGTGNWQQLQCAGHLTGLTAGAVYTVQVTAFNSGGESSRSADSNSITALAGSSFYVACGGSTQGEDPNWNDFSFNLAAAVRKNVAPGTLSALYGASAPTNPTTPANNVVELCIASGVNGGTWFPHVGFLNPDGTYDAIENGEFNLAPYVTKTVQIWPTVSGLSLFPGNPARTLFVYGVVTTGGTGTFTDATQSAAYGNPGWPANLLNGSLVFNHTKGTKANCTSNTATTVSGMGSQVFSPGDFYTISIPDVGVGQDISPQGSVLISNQWNTRSWLISAWDGGSGPYPQVSGKPLLKYLTSFNAPPSNAVVYLADDGFT